MTENKLYCPFCQQELKEIYCNGICLGLGCKNIDCLETKSTLGNKALWQELIRTKELLDIESAEHEMCHTQMLKTTEKLERTRKALDVAVDALKMIGSGDIIEHSVIGHEDDNKIFIARKALEQITALEQKE